MAVDEKPRLRRPTLLRLVDDACRSLEEAILSGRMRPGERLIETSIAAELGVSRSTVREALLMLERRGLVVNQPRHGAFVTRLSSDDALDIKVTRALLEGFAVRLNGDRIDDVLIGEMAAILSEMRSCELPRDLPRAVQLDLRFHQRLVRRVASRRLFELWASLNGQIGALMLRSVEINAPQGVDLIGLHEHLLEAVRTRDATTIERAIIDHYIGLQAIDHRLLRTMLEATDAVPTRLQALSRRSGSDTTSS